VLEDAAQAFDSTTASGRALGTLGLAGCMSFHETKNVSCGEGGALYTADAALARAVETIRDKGTNRAAAVRGETTHYTWVSPGSSFTLSDVLAAILEVQLAARDRILADRERVAALYRRRLGALAARHGLTLAPEPAPGERFNRHIVHVLVPPRIDRDAVGRGMRARGVGVAAHFQTLHDSPFMREVWPGEPPSLPVTADTCARLLRLPIYPGLADADVERVVEALAAELEDGTRSR
jgi:dTDP-4-amino-4,6-dideoxygalactose transaminase